MISLEDPFDHYPKNAKDIAKIFPISEAIKTIINSRYSLSPPDKTAIGISGFVRATLNEPYILNKNQYVIDIFGDNSKTTLEEYVNKIKWSPSGDKIISDKMYDAFNEANNLRQEISGNNKYIIELQHILFVIITSKTYSIREETERLLKILKVDSTHATDTISRHCYFNRSANENFEAWQNILKSRGLSHIYMHKLDSSSIEEMKKYSLEQLNNASKLYSINTEINNSLEGTFSTIKNNNRKEIQVEIPLTLPEERPDALHILDLRPPRPPMVALLRPDDPWASDARDATGSAAEAGAFADMVVARQFRPPLAVGVFGDWGSGKSFFLRQVHDAITRRNDKTQPLANDSPVQFCEHVVQIRFNAWHYAETNLWASLVDHILTSLYDWMSANGQAIQAETLLGSLTTARALTIEAAEALVAARKAEEDKRHALKAAETNLQDRRIAATSDPRSHLQTAFRTLIAAPKTKEALKETADRLGLPDLSDNVDAFAKVTRQLDTEIGRLALVRGGVIKELTGRGAAITFVALSGLSPALLGWIASLIAPGAELGASIAGVVTSASGALAWATGRSRAALGQIQTYQTRFEAVLATEVATEQARRDQTTAELASAEAEVAQAADALRTVSALAAQAAIAYHTETGASRVLHFVRNRITQGTYTKHLSFVASIRRDFEELTRFVDADWKPSPEAAKARETHARKVEELLAAAGSLLNASEQDMLRQSKNANPPDKARPFQRIVLYIDDLDRCRPAQVVAVLEAIQLLLTYPIFVVFVAVDVRWLRASLADQFQRQLSTAAGPNGEATTTDYLEKIFQIPYWVRSFGDEASRSLLRQHIGDQPAEPTKQAPEETAGKTPAARKADNKVIVGAAPASAQDAAGKIAAAAEAPPKAAVSSPPTDTDTPEPGMTHALQLTTGEIAALEAVAPFLTPLPRRVVRFLNTYRILKGSLAPADQAKLEEDGHRALIALLAIAFLAEEDFPVVARRLCSTEQANPKADVLDAVASLPETTRSRIRDCLATLGNPAPADLSVHVARVARFTFYQGT